MISRSGLPHPAECFPAVPFSVVLRTGRPDGRSFRCVEHAEVDTGGISDLSHLTTKGIDLPNEVPFSGPPYGRVAGHPPHGGRVHREEPF